MGILPAMTSIFRPVGGGQGMQHMPTSLPSLPNPLTHRQAGGGGGTFGIAPGGQQGLNVVSPPTAIAPLETMKPAPWANIGGQQLTGPISPLTLPYMSPGPSSGGGQPQAPVTIPMPPLHAIPFGGGQQQTPITTPSSPAKPIFSINQGLPNFLNMLMKSWQPTQTTQDSANPLQQLLASFFGPQGGPGGVGNGMYGQFGGGVPNYMQGLMGILNYLGAPLFTRSMQ